MLPEYYEFFCPVKILSGRKALANLPYELSQMGVSRPLVITDPGVAGAGLMKPVKEAFADSDLKIAKIFDQTPTDSSTEIVNRVAALYREVGCDCLVAVGGGSVIDTAKGVNIVVSEGTSELRDFQGVDRLTKPMRPLVAVPTTAGTGSEVTAAAVIFDPASNQKMAFMSNRLYPRVAIVDPVMTQTMPPKVTAATGMDALTHAVEAVTGLQRNPVSDGYAAAAIRLVGRHLLTAVEDGANREARLGMANASLLAGMAFSNSMVGVVHALAHATGALCHVPHGVANAIFLPHGMAYNLDKVPQRTAAIGEWLELPSSGDLRRDAENAVQAVRNLLSSLSGACGFPTRLSETGVTRGKLNEIAILAQNEGAVTYNPAEADRADLLSILEAAF